MNYIESFSEKIKKKHKTISKLKKEVSALKKKNTILKAKVEANQEELTAYINKLFEQQEKERIISSIINNIRDSLELNVVLEKTASEISKLLNLRRASICIYDKKNDLFTNAVEYVTPLDPYYEIKNNIDTFKISRPMYEALAIRRENILSKTNTYPIEEHILNLFKYIELNKFIAIPLTFKNDFLGILFVSGDHITFSKSEIEVLEDFAFQVAIAISHAQLYAEAQMHLQLKSEFIASVSHEIRTPINAIIGFSDILYNSPSELSIKQLEYLQNISMSGKHLLDLINNILDLSKLESGNCSLYYEKFSSDLVIKEVVMVLEGMASKKDITITTELCNTDIKADPKVFRQILYNLINNAIKFTLKDGHIHIKSLIKDNFLHIEIQDNGIGINKKYHSRIFEQFTQADSSYTKKQEGTGLGLTLAKKFINLHGGEINFESEEDKGSKFWFTLPLEDTNYSKIRLIIDNEKISR